MHALVVVVMGAPKSKSAHFTCSFSDLVMNFQVQKTKKLHFKKPGVLLWDIGPKCDAAERGVPSGAILFAYRKFIGKNGIKIKNHS